MTGLGSYSLWDKVTIQATPDNGFESMDGEEISQEKNPCCRLRS